MTAQHLLLALSITLTISLLLGCERDREVAATPPTQQDLFNSAKLDAAPLPVRAAFRDQFPDASIISVNTTTSAGGPRLYSITFNRGGVTDRVTYDETGVVVSAPAGDRNVNQGRAGFPDRTSPAR